MDHSKLKNMIFDLCRAGGVSGGEEEVHEAVRRYLDPYAEVSVAPDGTVTAVLGNENAEKTILLDAHLDRIGVIVTDIDERGFAKIDGVGGVDERTLHDARLSGKNGFTGTVCCLPPHLSDGGDKAAPMNKVWLDFGMSPDEVKKRVSIGDRLTFCTQPRELLGDKITAPALDNRCGVAALIRAAQLIDTTDYRVVILLSSQEETCGAGAKTGAFRVCADEAVCVDVSFAAQPDVSGQYGGIGLAKGPMICISPVLDRGMTDALTDLAEKSDIPYQLEPISGRTGTNGDHIAVTRGGVKTALVSVPQRYMHTPVEVISLCDVENTARLIAAYINSGGVQNG